MKVTVTGGFWKKYQDLVRKEVVPYQWEALNDRVEGASRSFGVSNMRNAALKNEAQAKGEKGNFPHGGFVFQDSDLYKWMECAGYLLEQEKDVALEEEVDSVVDLMERAQLPDGYLDTYYQLEGGLEKRLTNIRDHHELYCLGHMLEAALAYEKGTGKTKLLQMALRFVDYVNEHIGPEEGKLHAYPGHEELELALVKLYEWCQQHKDGSEKWQQEAVAKADQYLALARYFVTERGRKPLYFKEEAVRREGPDSQPFFYGQDELPDGSRPDPSQNLDMAYLQADLPVTEQTEVKGHAVRVGYFMSGVTDVARLTGDKALTQAADRLFTNVVMHKMSVNGGVGATEWGEAFGENDDLPNGTVYNESCASIALALWAERMNRLHHDASYVDVAENALYNGTLCGMSQDGHRFFYVNPLETEGLNVQKRHDRRHVKTVRQPWFGCACCPPNIARVIASIGSRMAYEEDGILYVNSFATCQGEGLARWTMTTDYPYGGNVNLHIEKASGLSMRLRCPSWARGKASVRLNQRVVSAPLENGYFVLPGALADGDEIEMSLPMEVRCVYANVRLGEDVGKVALMRGPLLYCLEQVDNGTGLSAVFLPRGAAMTEEKETAATPLKGTIKLKAEGMRMVSAEDSLYSETAPSFEKCPLTFIPYYLWGNRLTSPDRCEEMRVFVREMV